MTLCFFIISTIHWISVVSKLQNSHRWRVKKKSITPNWQVQIFQTGLWNWMQTWPMSNQNTMLYSFTTRIRRIRITVSLPIHPCRPMTSSGRGRGPVRGCSPNQRNAGWRMACRLPSGQGLEYRRLGGYRSSCSLVRVISNARVTGSILNVRVIAYSMYCWYDEEA